MKTQSLIELRAQQRRNGLLLFIVTYVFTRGLAILGQVTALSKGVRTALNLTAAVMAFVFCVIAFRWYRFARTIQAEPGVSAALNDERVRSLRQRAFVFGFFTLIAYQVSLLLMGMAGVGLPLGLAGELGIFVGVVSLLGAFWTYDRADG